jgi:hypothetical protein
MNAILKRRPEASQRFPYVPLGKAIDRAKDLYKVANGHEVPIATAVSAWGFAEKSSGGAQTAAALKAFGLLEDVSGSDVRKVKLTDAAMRIIRDPREISPDRDALIREAALKPLLHREIVEKYGGLPPSDEVLKAFLLIDRGLKDGAVPEFIREFAATMSLAKIAEPAIQDVNLGAVAPIQSPNFGQDHDELPFMSPGVSESGSKHAAPMTPWPAGMEMRGAKDEYNLMMYSSAEGSRIRVTADLNLNGVKQLAKLLESRIKMMEEEEQLMDSRSKPG